MWLRVKRKSRCDTDADVDYARCVFPGPLLRAFFICIHIFKTSYSCRTLKMVVFIGKCKFRLGVLSVMNRKKLDGAHAVADVVERWGAGATSGDTWQWCSTSLYDVINVSHQLISEPLKCKAIIKRSGLGVRLWTDCSFLPILAIHPALSFHVNSAVP